MNLREYLARRSKSKSSKALTHAEASLLRIPWPLPRKWPKQYGLLEIDADLLACLDAAVKVRKERIASAKRRPNKDETNKRVRNDLETILGRPLAAPVVTQLPTKKVAAPEQRTVFGSGFYESREWRELRYKALVINGAKCQCCGATRNDGVRLHVDHIKPRSKFPKLQLELTNLQVLCEDCNLGKSNKDATDWR